MKIEIIIFTDNLQMYARINFNYSLQNVAELMRFVGVIGTINLLKIIISKSSSYYNMIS